MNYKVTYDPVYKYTKKLIELKNSLHAIRTKYPWYVVANKIHWHVVAINHSRIVVADKFPRHAIAAEYIGMQLQVNIFYMY